MRATQTIESRAAGRAAATKLTKPRRSLIGEFSDEQGVRHECWLAPSKRVGEGLAYVSRSGELPRCLGLLGGAGSNLQREARAIFADYRAAESESRRCRAVSPEEAAELALPGERRRSAGAEEVKGEEQGAPLCFDGRALYEWLIAERVITEGKVTPEHGEAKARRINDWKNGGKASIGLVDELLTAKGHHVSEIPDEIGRRAKRTKKRPRRIPAAQQLIAVERYRAGESAVALAAVYGVSDHSIRNWARKAAVSIEATAAAA